MRLPFTKLAGGVVLGCAVAALLASGCSAPPPRQSPRVPGSVAASATSGGLTLSVEIPASELSAGTTQTATTTLVNSTETTIADVQDPIHVTVSDSAGKTVYDSLPGTIHFIYGTLQPLAPHATLRQRLSFKAPPPGAYTITASQHDHPRPDFRPAVHFTSVR